MRRSDLLFLLFCLRTHTFIPQLGESPTHIGLMFLLCSGVYALSAPVIGWIGDKTVSVIYIITKETSTERTRDTTHLYKSGVADYNNKNVFIRHLSS